MGLRKKAPPIFTRDWLLGCTVTLASTYPIVAQKTSAELEPLF